MTDGNTYAINKHINDQEDRAALQEAATELWEAEAEVKKYHDAWLEAEAQIIELEAKLAKAIEVLEYEISRSRRHLSAKTLTTLEELKGRDDE